MSDDAGPRVDEGLAAEMASPCALQRSANPAFAAEGLDDVEPASMASKVLRAGEGLLVPEARRVGSLAVTPRAPSPPATAEGNDGLRALPLDGAG